jgi:hypothetical protein
MNTTIHGNFSAIDADAYRKWTLAFKQVDPNELARSCADAGVDLDLAQRVAAM